MAKKNRRPNKGHPVARDGPSGDVPTQRRPAPPAADLPAQVANGPISAAVHAVVERFAGTMGGRPERWDYALLLVGMFPAPDTDEVLVLQRVYMAEQIGEMWMWSACVASDHTDPDEIRRAVGAALDSLDIVHGRNGGHLLWVTVEPGDQAAATATEMPVHVGVQVRTFPGLTPAHLDDLDFVRTIVW